MKRLAVLYVFLLSLLLPLSSQGQNHVIGLFNPSFEDGPRPGKIPRGWVNCGAPGESPPDVHPGNFFGVMKESKHGYTYLGMVARDNATGESIGQELDKPMEAGKCYLFSLYACRSDIFSNRSRKTLEEAEFTNPLKIKIWGSNTFRERTELLAESKLINGLDWEPVGFMLKPSQNYNYLIMEAAHQENVVAYNGHVLVDNLTPILEVSCDQLKPLEPFEEITLKYPDTYEELLTFLKKQNQNLHFTPSGKFEQQVLRMDKETILYDNKALSLIVTAVRAFPTAFLTLHLPKKRIEQEVYLRQNLYNLGLTPYQFKIKIVKDDSHNKKWLAGFKETDIPLQIKLK